MLLRGRPRDFHGLLSSLSPYGRGIHGKECHRVKLFPRDGLTLPNRKERVVLNLCEIEPLYVRMPSGKMRNEPNSLQQLIRGWEELSERIALHLSQIAARVLREMLGRDFT